MTAGLANTIKNIGQKPKPQIQVKIHDSPEDAFRPLVYTSSDEIKGEVLITTQTDLAFDDIYITFEGSTRTYVEKIATASATNAKTEAFQNFLRLMQPFDPEAFTDQKVLEAHRTYQFPFVFVVPERLLPQSCSHPVEGHFDRDVHLALPPTLGDPMPATGSSKTLIDDMMPDMGCIAYSVRCRITSGRGPSGKHLIIAEGTKKLRIIPAVEEQPPIDVRGGAHDDYQLRKEKSIRKGTFRQKLGRVAIESVQPTSLRLPSVRSDQSGTVTTMATINLRFDPLDGSAKPPKLQNVSSKLKIGTFYATMPMRELPGRSSDYQFSSFRGLYVDSIPLAQRCMANTTWQKHDGSIESNTPPRRDSAWSTAATKIPAPTKTYNAKHPYYTAHVVVPISLPKGNRVFVPSFHSCLMSRVYALDLVISISTPGTHVKDPTLHLKLPIQVSAEGEPHEVRPLTVAEMDALTAENIDSFFQPRNIGPPPAEVMERSSLPGSQRNSPRVSFSNRNSVAAEDSSPLSSPRQGFTQRDSIAEEGGAWQAPTRTSTSIASTGLGLYPRVLGESDIPPSPGPGYSHRPSVEQQSPAYSVRMIGTQQRFQSLSFENEENALAPPPGYERVGRPRQSQRGSSNTPTASSRSSERETR